MRLVVDISDGSLLPNKKSFLLLDEEEGVVVDELSTSILSSPSACSAALEILVLSLGLSLEEEEEFFFEDDGSVNDFGVETLPPLGKAATSLIFLGLVVGRRMGRVGVELICFYLLIGWFEKTKRDKEREKKKMMMVRC